MYGRFTSVCCAEDSSILAFSAASFQALHGQRIVTQVNALIFLKLVNEVVDQAGIEVFTTRGYHRWLPELQRFFAINFVDFDNRDIESTTTEVVNRDSTVADFFIQTVSQRCGSRFVDDTFNFQPAIRPASLVA